MNQIKFIYAGREVTVAWNRRAELENELLTCDGCEHDGGYENEMEYGYPSPCTKCRRIATDNYRTKPERSEG